MSEIDKLKAELKKLKKYKKRAELFEDATFEAIAIIDEKFKCIDCNKQLTTMFQYSKEEMFGKYGPELVANDYREISIRNGRTNYNKPYECKMLRKDGSEFWGIVQGKDIIKDGKNYRVITVTNISKQKEYEIESLEKTNEFEAIFQNSQIGIVLTDENRVIKKANNVFREILKVPKDISLIGKNIKDFYSSEKSFDNFWALNANKLLKNEPVIVDYQYQNYHGNPIWGHVSGRPIDNGETPDLTKGIVWVTEDITERKKMEIELKNAYKEINTIFENTSVAMIVMDEKYRVLKANKKFLDLHGFENEEEAIGIYIYKLYANSKDFFKNITNTEHTLNINKSVEFDIEAINRNGEKFWLTVSGKKYYIDEKKTQAKSIWVSQDITNRKLAEKRLQEISRTDDLTGVYNRRYFMEQLEREIKIHKNYNHPLSLLMLDIDFFKLVNDTYGHLVGDKALKYFATICSLTIRDIDILARIGGEEFAILLIETPLEKAVKIANEIRENIIDLTAENELLPKLTVSIGLTSIESDDSLSSFMHRSDNLLYKAKNNGRNQVEYL